MKVGFTKRDRMIDIGCGPANNSSEIAKLHKEVSYLDISENMLKLAKRNMGNNNKQYIKDDITNPKKDLFNGGHFDTATIFGLASVIDKDNFKKPLENTKKLLSEDGILLMTYPRKTVHRLYYTKIKQNFIENFFKPVVKNYSYSGNEISKLVKSLGFSSLRIYKLPRGDSSLLIAKK
jgi:ubiquinone/menaquinone biosynthesis C-methylase UbiE